MRRLLLVIFLAGGLLFGVAQWRVQSGAVWTRIAPGVEMRTLRSSLSGGAVRVVALRTSPSRIGIVTGTTLSAAEWRRRESAVVAVNGGYFDTEGRSLGLRITKGRRTARLHGLKWGVFYIRGGKASIVSGDKFKMHPAIREAVQCGPRLVIKGKPTQLKQQWARRTGIGVQRDGRVIIAASDGELSFQEWAALWASATGLNCRDALNLDGGSSTQLSLRTRSHNLEIPSGRTVPDAVVIK